MRDFINGGDLLCIGFHVTEIFSAVILSLIFITIKTLDLQLNQRLLNSCFLVVICLCRIGLRENPIIMKMLFFIIFMIICSALLKTVYQDVFGKSLKVQVVTDMICITSAIILLILMMIDFDTEVFLKNFTSIKLELAYFYEKL